MVNKNNLVLYVREGFENRPFWIFDPFPRPTGLRSRSQIWKGLFSDPFPIPTFFDFNVAIWSLDRIFIHLMVYVH